MFFFIVVWFFQIKNKATPIIANRVVQTGANTHAGGLRAGFTSVEYQPAMDGAVNSEPIMPASSDTTMAMMSLNVLFIFIIELLASLLFFT